LPEEYKRPIPIPDPASAAYWEGAKRHELTLKHCNDCGFYIHYPKTRCPKCWSTNVGDAVVSGRGTIYTLTVHHVPSGPGFETPYPVALVSLEEQESVHIMANIVESPLEEIKVGMPVEVVFHDVTDEITIPLFRPRKG
jgi:uncharacterized OB-fold protein